MRAQLIALGCAASWLALGAGCRAEVDTAVKLEPSAVPEQRDTVRAFYSGHSLTDGVPEEVAKIAASLAQKGKPGDFDFEFQSGWGALIAARSVGLPGSEPGSGYRFGRNRHGEGMDVVQEWRQPRTLAQGERYNVLVITERNSLPWSIYHDQTVPALAEYAGKFTAESPNGEVLLYHGWLNYSWPVEAWLEYERAALPLWECVASAVNRGAAEGAKKIHVLPGATALTDFVQSALEGRAPGFGGDQQARLDRIFADTVHLAPLGLYFMGLVHYAALFGHSPAGAVAPEGVTPELAAFMQELAWQHVASYAKRAEAAASRDMAFCRDYAAEVMCRRYYQYHKPQEGSLIDRAKFMKQAFECPDGFEDPADPSNPFRAP